MRVQTPVAALGAGLVLVVLAGTPSAQRARTPPPTVDIVSTVGCAVKVSGTPPTWTLTRAADPAVSPDPFASPEAVDEARTQPLGSRSFPLVGVAEYLTNEDRQELSVAGNQVVGFQQTSTGQLRDGHHVAIRGLLVEVDGEQRINLTSVVSLDDTCG